MKLKYLKEYFKGKIENAKILQKMVEEDLKKLEALLKEVEMIEKRK